MLLKIDLREISISIIIYQGKNKTEIKLVKGQYKDLFYDYLVILDRTVFLERGGGELEFLFSDFDSIIIKVDSPLERLASKYGSDVYVLGDMAIPDEELREAMKFLLYS
ncbi:MAG: hypothetical protein QW607_06655 [Desulfurococcaceae archaeon]